MKLSGLPIPGGDLRLPAAALAAAALVWAVHLFLPAGEAPGALVPALASAGLVGIGAYGFWGRRFGRERRRLAAVTRMVQLIREDYPVISDHALSYLLEATGSRYGFFGLVDEDETRLSTYAWSRQAMRDCRIGGGCIDLPVEGAGLWAEAVRRRAPIVVNDYASAPGRKGLPEGHVPLRRLLVVPVVRDGRVRALAGLANKALPYTAADVAEAEAFLVHAQAILERKFAERALRVGEARYRGLFQNAHDGIVLHDLAGRILEVNPRMLELTGFPAERLRGMHVKDLHPPAALETSREVLERTARDGHVRFEIEFLRADGTTFPAEVSASVFEAGDRRLVQGVVRDIGDRQAAERALHNLSRRLSLILESAGEGILGLDREGRLTFANPAAAHMLGYEVEDLVGRDAHGTWHHARADETAYPRQECPIFASLRDGVVFRADDEVFWRRDGTAIPVHYVSAPIVEEGGIVGAVVIFQNIAARKAAEDDRRRLQRQLIHAQKMEAVGQLAGGVAHDFNNILTALSGYTELALVKLPEDHPARRDVLEIRRGADRAAALTRQLLAFSRRQPLETRVIDVNDLIREMEKMLRRLIGEDVTLETDLAPDLDRVKADPGQVEQVVMNLAVNARDAMPEGGRLRIRTRRHFYRPGPGVEEDRPATPGAYVCIEVADTGEGMDAETLQHVFEPFFSTKGPGRGTGLGLSVVYGIVRQHGGWIDVRSTLGRGSAFEVYLPAFTFEAGGGIPAHAADGETPAGRGECVLVVEDEDEVRALAAAVLSEAGYRVLAAGSAEEAAGILRREDGRVDLVFCDVVLPDRSGLQLAEDLAGSGVRFLMCSGYSDHRSQWPVIRERGYRFLQKPYRVADLLREVRAALDAEAPVS
ncbi:PAS domain S-box protein [Dissulfurirhabdus thermomarina]|uniref:histidine kinase n=1 Tax=Dissulfurirhabdus thermomarina TaxID=1765737 RepID=A0A6N9TQE4_DISTH|nr:PAS domain S-box protein [Dissulfurirhabdus thermomarina]NDY41657.1 PAS domain S-box protein [Dissulfurirhabdus thermomarina]NMX24349.1 PAS domain S-box protein [Dissulfurirhabdus thermomarina]